MTTVLASATPHQLGARPSNDCSVAAAPTVYTVVPCRGEYRNRYYLATQSIQELLLAVTHERARAGGCNAQVADDDATEITSFSAECAVELPSASRAAASHAATSPSSKTTRSIFTITSALLPLFLLLLCPFHSRQSCFCVRPSVRSIKHSGNLEASHQTAE